MSFQKIYPIRNRQVVPEKPLSSNIGRSTVELRCEVFHPIAEAKNKPDVLIFYLKNAYNSMSAPLVIDTVYIVNMGDIKVTELGALIDNHWKIPAQGARGTKSGQFISALKGDIEKAFRKQGMSDLKSTIESALQNCMTDLFTMNMSGNMFRSGNISRLESTLKDLLAKKSATSFGGKFDKWLSAGEALEEVNPGDEFIFAVVKVLPELGAFEFIDTTRPVYGSADDTALTQLLTKQVQYNEDTATVNEQTKDKQYNRLYNTASDLLKYQLLSKGIDTAGSIGRAIAGDNDV